MELTAAEVRVLRETFAMVHLVAKTATRLFYTRLFEVEPSLRLLLAESLPLHQIQLMATLKLLVETLDQPEAFQAASVRLRNQHADVVQTDGVYSAFTEALLWTWRQALGRSFTPEVHAAWVHFCAVLASAMQSAVVM